MSLRADVISLRRIEMGEDITFDYNTTEYDMDEPLTCHCSSPDYPGTIQGFRLPTTAQQERLLPLLPACPARHPGTDPTSTE
jgi:hypothetical protein